MCCALLSLSLSLGAPMTPYHYDRFTPGTLIGHKMINSLKWKLQDSLGVPQGMWVWLGPRHL